MCIGICLVPQDPPIHLRVRETYADPSTLFFTRPGRVLWNAVCRAHPVSVETVRAEVEREIAALREKGVDFELPRGWEPENIYSKVSWDDVASWKRHFDRLQELRQARQALIAILKAEEALWIANDVPKTLSDLNISLSSILREDEALTSGDSAVIAEEALAEWQAPDPKAFVCTGLPIDNEIWGLNIHDGEVVGLSGPEKAGKTRLATHILRNIMKQGVRTVYLTLESGQARLHVWWRFVAQAVAEEALSRGMMTTLSDRDLRFRVFEGSIAEGLVRSVIEKAKGWPLAIYSARPKEGRTRDLSSLSAIIETEARYRGAKVFVVDPIQRVDSGAKGIYERMEALTDTLSGLSLAHGVVIIGVSHLSTEYRRHFMDSDLVETKGGGGFVGEANLIMEVKRDGEDTVVLNLKASRYSAGAKYLLRVDPKTGLVINGEKSD